MSTTFMLLYVGSVVQFYALGTSKRPLEWAPSCASAPTLWLYSAAPLRRHSRPVAQSVECRSPMREIGNSIPGLAKSVTYNIDTNSYLARCSALLV